MIAGYIDINYFQSNNAYIRSESWPILVNAHFFWRADKFTHMSGIYFRDGWASPKLNSAYHLAGGFTIRRDFESKKLVFQESKNVVLSGNANEETQESSYKELGRCDKFGN